MDRVDQAYLDAILEGEGGPSQEGAQEGANQNADKKVRLDLIPRFRWRRKLEVSSEFFPKHPSKEL